MSALHMSIAASWVVSHIHELSCYIWLSRCDMLHMNESCAVSHDTHVWVLSLMNSACVMSHVTYNEQTFHIWMSRHVTWKNESWLVSRVTYQWVMSDMNASCHIWMRHVCHATYEFVVVTCHKWMRHVLWACDKWMSHVTYLRLMSHAYCWGTSYQSHHIPTSRVSWVISHMNAMNDMNETCLMSYIIYQSVTQVNTSCQV